MLEQTPSQTIGPFFSYGLFFGGEHILVNDRTRGERIVLTGTLLDGDGEPVTDGMVEIWQADANGFFNHPHDPNQGGADANFRGFGRSQTIDRGTFRFETIKPGSIAGATAAAPYVNVRIFARGLLIHLVTRIYFDDEAANDADPVLSTLDDARRTTILARRIASAQIPIYRLDIRLQGEGETVFFDV